MLRSHAFLFEVDADYVVLLAYPPEGEGVEIGRWMIPGTWIEEN